MAKRKLSSDQRAELRSDLKKGAASGQKTADLLREVAKKYGITTITARWYLKSLDGRAKGRGARRGRRPGRPPGSGSATTLVKLVEAQSRNAQEARRLVPRWQKLVSREAELRRQASRVERKLAATSKRAGALRRRIDALVGA
jgi:hypothetical protein